MLDENKIDEIKKERVSRNITFNAYVENLHYINVKAFKEGKKKKDVINEIFDNARMNDVYEECKDNARREVEHDV